MTHVWLVRHGATTAPRGVAIGATDPPLSDEGVEQAERLASQLAVRRLTRVMSSDLKRACATARAIAGRHDVAVEVTPALREIDFGAWEGRSLVDLWSEEPRAARAWELDIRSTPSSFAEDLADLEGRLADFWRSVDAPCDGGEIAIVGHRCSLAVLRSVITGESLEAAFAVTLGLAEMVAVATR